MGKITKKQHILIVEDEGDICLILNLMLKNDDVEIEHVNSLAKTTTYLQDNKPDVVILDNQLPDGLGIDFIATIKAQYPAIKIIMITGNAADNVQQQALANGAHVFLAKPFTKEQILQALAS
ncbi:response regulator [Ferruginibacter yonginensis]|uniref:Response regulator n=1 Tax=Ferruginibacter yonginensis TaxID=1310416 RepID=A0ABV8QU08_9BACT